MLISGTGKELAFLLTGCLDRDGMLKAGVNVSQGSFLKYTEFGFRASDSRPGQAFNLGVIWSIFPRVPGETSSFPTYSIQRNICFSLLGSQNNRPSIYHLFCLRTHSCWLTHAPPLGVTLCAPVKQWTDFDDPLKRLLHSGLFNLLTWIANLSLGNQGVTTDSLDKPRVLSTGSQLNCLLSGNLAL